MSLSGYTNTPILPEKAKELMSLDTEYKEIITYGKIEEWFTAWDGKVYVSFSGGKDSTVLAYLAATEIGGVELYAGLGGIHFERASAYRLCNLGSIAQLAFLALVEYIVVVVA